MPAIHPSMHVDRTVGGHPLNRFEALHVLGLDETASDEDIRLAYYGLTKAVKLDDYAASERVSHRVEALLSRAKEARDFLLSKRNQTAARMVQQYTGTKKRAKVTVSSEEEKTARLHGLETVRALLVSYLVEERSKRRSCIWALVACVVVGFVVLRYIRVMPARVAAFTVLAGVAIAASTILTSAHGQVRTTRGYIADLDVPIRALRVELGLQPPEEDGYDSVEARERAQDEQEAAEAVMEGLSEDAEDALDAEDPDAIGADSVGSAKDKTNGAARRGSAAKKA